VDSFKIVISSHIKSYQKIAPLFINSLKRNGLPPEKILLVIGGNEIKSESTFNYLQQNKDTNLINLLNNDMGSNFQLNEINKLCNNIRIHPNEIRLLRFNPLKSFYDCYQNSLAIYKQKENKSVRRIHSKHYKCV
jgi:hypothetical protein